jgi:hypothetical protein
VGKTAYKKEGTDQKIADKGCFREGKEKEHGVGKTAYKKEG